MYPRVIDLSDRPARLRIRNELLCIEPAEMPETTVPASEVVVLVLSNPQVTLSQSVLSRVLSRGGVVITCDEKRMPCGMMMPLDGHHGQSKRFAAQARAKVPLRKRLWAEIVRSKILNQAAVLTEHVGKDCGVGPLVDRVRSGDPGNVEAHAAKRYWRGLFGEYDFKRDRELQGINSLLNYGYAVLRAIVARAICGSGLHPCIGIHHRNQYNSFCLADDLMEPFRPGVDLVVARLSLSAAGELDLNQAVRREILRSVTGRWRCGEERLSVFEACGRLAASLSACFLGQARSLDLPSRISSDG